VQENEGIDGGSIKRLYQLLEESPDLPQLTKELVGMEDQRMITLRWENTPEGKTGVQKVPLSSVTANGAQRWIRKE
jgi:hypothetical protein